jgi:hypothetical protein
VNRSVCFRIAGGWVLSCALLAAFPSPALAQSGLLAQSFVARSFWLDAAIFVALAGGAVFAVCRSSKRV